MMARKRWQQNALVEALRMARDGLIEIRTPAGEIVDPWSVEQAPEDGTWVLTEKGREYVARTRLGERPD